jgi:glyoxylase-like metal-dependent hydrolase (beta-lactamase superfamily II)
MADNPIEQFKQSHATPEEATFYWTGGPVEVAERTWFVSHHSGVVAFETDEGLVLVDSGSAPSSAGMAGALRSVTTEPVHTAVYTHGHIDHAFGLPAFLRPGQEAPRVIAHRAAGARFRRYADTGGYNMAINSRQITGNSRDRARVAQMGWGAPPIEPDTMYEDELTVVAGGLTFELHHARGETDDHTWIYNPERGVLCPGDLVIWAVPNAGNPQKVQRYPWEWAGALRAMAAKRPRSMCPGHGGPVVDDPEKIQRILLETADFLDTIVSRTLEVLNDGAPPHVDVVHRVVPPASDSPWLQPVYDEAEFIVRNTVRAFGGWYSGRPSELKPAPRADLARAVAELAGGVDVLLTRAEAAVAAGDLRLACHLADWALESEPGKADVQERCAAVYTARSESETSLMAVNIYRSAVTDARAGRAFH